MEPEKKKKKKPRAVISHEEEIFLMMLYRVIEKKMKAIEKTNTHIVNGDTHFDYSNLNRDRKKEYNAHILTFRRKCKAVGISFGDCCNEAEALTKAYLEEERKLQEQKLKEFLRKG